MEYNRYGKFRARDYFSAWLAIIVYLLIVIFNLKDAPFYLLALPIILSVDTAWSVYAPNRERFSIIGNMIIAKKGRRKMEITIPSEPTLIVSYVDICPPMEKRVGSLKSYVLKDRYAISIIQKMKLEDVLVHLHEKYVKKYSNETIEASFSRDCFFYSFVCEGDLLNKVLQNRQCLLIIPESLSEKIVFNSEAENVYIDMGY